MVKKKAELPVTPTTRGLSRRAASKEALKQMQRISSSVYEEPETFEILSDEEDVIPVEPPPKKKYKVTHRKSSDGNDRDILVLRTINWGEQTLNLDTWVEELSPAQVEMRKKAQQEYDDMNAKLTKYLADNSCEVVYESDFCTAYEVDQQQPGFIYAAAQPPPSGTPSKSNGAPGNFQLVMDPRSGVVVGTMTPTSSSSSSSSALPPKHTSRKRGRPLSTGGTPSKIPKVSSSQSSGVPLRPTEANAVGGLSTGHAGKKSVSFNSTSTTASLSPSPVVDLTSEAAAASSTKHVADSREVSFNKLQGKTYPSLVVVARPHLRVKEGGTLDRVILDSKVKGVLMHVPTKFTEWLIQQGLIRSEQSCSSHTSNKLKLGMYGDVSKFPLSGGYVWISECCPQRFVSVFSGSLFEGSPHAPSVILKLIYHWCCQTNVQNVVQWVKVENLFVKGLNTWLRAICTVALHSHLRAIGGPGIRVEIGVISLGTTSQDGAQRQVKVEVLGILETETKHIRLRAVEPLSDGDKNYKKRFAKILEPLAAWVHPDSIIVTDLTVDKSTLLGMGFKNIQQVAGDPNGNQMIMDYLRRIVPRMFQNTLSLLSRQIIQQFLDELVWREWYGTSAAQAFDNLIIHASQQTRTDTGQSLILRLNRVSGNPFKNWSIKTFANGGSSSGGGSGGQSNSEVGNGSSSSYSSSSGSKTSALTSSDGIKRPARQRKVPVKGLSPPPEPTGTSVKISKNTSVELPEQMVPLEHYYYGTITGKVLTDSVEVNIKCVMCKLQFGNNIKLMSHLFSHAHTTGTYQCKYCLTGVATEESLEKHIQANHPGTTKCGSMYACIICETKFSTTYLLGKHMSLEHLPSELPYLCGTCGFRCSSHKQAIDHFYAKHDGGNTIQCPFCLKSTTIASGTRMITQNLNFFLQHLQKHQKKTVAKKCAKCALWFVQKEGIKDHMKMHETQRRKAGFSPWRMEKQNISVPKSLNEEPIEEEDLDITKLVINVSENQSCKECNTPMNSPNHFPSVLTCDNENCQYITCCQQAMNKHAIECKTFGANLPSLDLPCTMFCVCSFSCSDGNQLAKHLSVCERKSAYPTLEAAKSATVTHSMLDVLGLMRRPEEPTPSTNTNTSDVMEILSDDDDSVKDASLSEQIAKIAANVDDDAEDKTTDERPGQSSTEEPPKDDISDEKEPSKDKESSVEKEGSIEKDSSGEKESLAENETTSEREVSEEQQTDEPKEPSDETMEISETLETGDKSEMESGSKDDTSDDKIVKSVESDKIDDNEEPDKVDLNETNESDSNQAEKMDVDDSIDAPEESTSDSREVDDSGAQKESTNENEVPNVETPDESNQSSIDKNDDQPVDKDESDTVLNNDDVSLKGNDDLLKDDDVEMATVESVSDENVETDAADKDNPDDMSTDSSIVAPVDSIESSSNPETTALIASGETDPELPAESVSSDSIQTPTLDNTGETIAEEKIDEETGAESES